MKLKYPALVTVLVIAFSSLSVPSIAYGNDSDIKPPYKQADLPVERRIEDLLERMTVREKVGQLLCPMGWKMYERNGDSISLTLSFDELMQSYPPGSLWAVLRADPWTEKDFETGLSPETAATVLNRMQRKAVEETRLGIPLLFAEECAHGHMAIGTTVFPTGLLQASSWNPELIRQMGEAIGKEAASQGVHIGFGPVLDIARDPRWSRMEEGFGEDPFLCGKIGAAAVRGMQQHIYSTLKHFAAYGIPRGGLNGNPADVGARQLADELLPPFREAVKAGAATIMTSYNSIDGIPCTANGTLLNDVLRQEWGFEGAVFSDLFSIDGMVGARVAENRKQAAESALNAGTDIDLGSSAYRKLEESIESGKVSSETLDKAVARVLRLKFEAGLFENPYVTEFVPEKETNPSVHSDRHVALAKEVACQGIVLLENNGVLPLSAEKLRRVAVIGPNADTPYNYLGDYTAPQRRKDIVTVLDAVKARLPEAKVEYVKGCSIRDEEDADIKGAVRAAKKAEAVILVVGGSSARDFGTEFLETGAAATGANGVQDASDGVAAGHRRIPDMDCGEGYDRASLRLSDSQEELIAAVAATGKPLITVFIEGRPMNMNSASELSDALLTAWYPGEQGGAAICDVIFGDCEPGGRLPVSIPRHEGQIPLYYSQGRQHDYTDMESSPLYPFGYGLGYTDFEYSGLETALVKPGLCQTDTLVSISFSVKNIGKRSGYAVPQLYLTDKVASVSLPQKRLKGFKKLYLEAGETAQVQMFLTSDDLSFHDENMEFILEPGRFGIAIGDSSQDVRLECEFTLPAEAVPDGYIWPSDKAVAEKLAEWQKLKFGVIFHWGLYSIPGIVESWSICAEDVDWINRRTDLNYEDYKRWYNGLALAILLV